MAWKEGANPNMSDMEFFSLSSLVVLVLHTGSVGKPERKLIVPEKRKKAIEDQRVSLRCS